MICSMTSFARHEAVGDWGTLVWEVRSLNHRYLEVSVRLPEDMRALENQIREKVKKKLGRGKVECSLRFRPHERLSAQIQLNSTLAMSLATACQQIAQDLTHPAAISPADIVMFPGVIQDSNFDREPIMERALGDFSKALDQLVQCRAREGEAIKVMIETRARAVLAFVNQARVMVPEVLQKMREKFRLRLREIAVEVDSGRMEQELAILMQKLDVDEELDRLENHLFEVQKNLARGEPVGRRLDFLMQELNREANTLGSKSADAQLTGISVELKVLIEQMREQIQNIE